MAKFSIPPNFHSFSTIYQKSFQTSILFPTFIPPFQPFRHYQTLAFFPANAALPSESENVRAQPAAGLGGRASVRLPRNRRKTHYAVRPARGWRLRETALRARKPRAYRSNCANNGRPPPPRRRYSGSTKQRGR